MKKIEVVRQQDLKDCGCCCLLSIIKYYGGYVPLEKIRIDTETSLEGTSAYHLVKTAINYGFDSYGVKLSSIEELESIVLPAIAHVVENNINHFIVIYKVTKKDIYVMDPAKGKVKLNKEHFKTIWTFHLIVLYPKYQIPQIKEKNHIIEVIKSIFKREKKLISKIIVLNTIFTIFTIITGFYFKIGISFMQEFEEQKILAILLTIFLSVYLLKFFLLYLRSICKIEFNKNFDGIILYDFLKHLFLLPNYFIKDRTTGEIIIRMKELENLKAVLSEIMITILPDSILAFSVGILLYSINKTLFFILVLCVLIYGISGIITGKILYKKALIVNESEIAFESIVIENIDSYLTIKNLNIEESFFKKIEKHLFKYLSKSHNLNRIITNTNNLSFFIEEILNFLIISFGIILIIDKKLSIVDLITFESLMVFFLTPFKNIINLIPSYSYAKVCIQKINDFYNLEEEQKNIGYNSFKNGNIEIKDLSFSYNPFSNLFNHFNLVIPKNSFVFFKGPSGCGKSTICQIISRLLEIKNQNVTIAEINIKDYSLETIRKNITYVSQKENLIQDTIMNNILLGRNINDDKLKEITKLCEIESIVEKKPLRYETFLAKDSINISGGEKQRIILARALLNDFQILILDEALSELNSELEIKIIKNLKKYLKNKTVIYVSHKNHEKYFDKVIDFKEAKWTNI